MNNYQTDFLVPEDSFLTGLASLFDVRGDLYVYNNSKSPEEADARAMASDWYNIGDDIQNAMWEYSKS